MTGRCYTIRISPGRNTNAYTDSNSHSNADVNSYTYDNA